MKIQRVALLAFAFLFPLAPIEAQEAAVTTPAVEEFELQFGDNTFDVRLNEPMMLRTPAGEEVQVVLRAKGSHRASARNVTFQFPPQTRMTQKELAEYTQFDLQSEDKSPLLMVQIYSEKVPADQMIRAIPGSLRAAYAEQFTIGKDTDRQVKRTIAGQETVGLAYVLETDAGNHLVESYALKVDGRAVALVLQHKLEDRAAGDRLIRTVADSLETATEQNTQPAEGSK